MLTSSCSGPADNASAANSNAGEQANNNSKQPPAADSSTALKVVTIPPPVMTPLDPVSPVEKPPVEAPEVAKATTDPAHSPKLITPDKKIDFGKQPQDKTLVRAITISNGGHGLLNIESVVPS